MSYTTEELIQIKTNEIRRLHGVCRTKDEMLKRIADAGKEALDMLRSHGIVNGDIYGNLNLAIDEARETIG